jgi:hypothetical protein
MSALGACQMLMGDHTEAPKCRGMSKACWFVASWVAGQK